MSLICIRCYRKKGLRVSFHMNTRNGQQQTFLPFKAIDQLRVRFSICIKAACSSSSLCVARNVWSSGPAVADAGPNARPGRGAQCKTQARGPSEKLFYDVIVFSQPCYDRGTALTRELGTFATFEMKFSRSGENVLCWQWNLYVVSTEFSSARCIWQKGIIYASTKAWGPMQLHRLHRLNPGILTCGFCHVYTNVGCAWPGFQK